MKKMIFKPNYSKAENAAHQLLLINNVDKLPVKVKKLSKRFSNLRIKSYSWFANKTGMTIEDVCDFANSNEGCCYFKKSSNEYLILYNDTVENKGRIRWTIAHELGHFMLKHNETSNRTTLGRSTLSESEYEVFEKEANCFARELLAPPTVIIKLGKVSIFDIQNLCDMSIEAAKNVISFLNTGQEMGRGFRYNSNLAKMFSKFIYNITNNYYCRKCRCRFVHESPSYCPNCGTDRISKSKILYISGGNDMKYDGYELDKMGRALICPTCDNENLFYDGEYCNVCGTYLINKCADTDRIDSTNWEYTQPSCNTTLSGNSRFCIKCGNESTFFQQKLLDEWNIEKNELKRMRELDKVIPF